jgi:hypothetical protein
VRTALVFIFGGSLIVKNNPHNLCIWASNEVCEDCDLAGKLHCHKDTKYTIIFGVAFLPYILAVGVGFLNIGWHWLTFLGVGGLVGYILFFFLYWEQRMLCNHCPYYGEGSTRMHCFDKEGLPKPGTYNPGPLTQSEKIQFGIGTSIFVGYPLVFLYFGGQILPLLGAVLGIGVWLFVMLNSICLVCVNFSCPLNRVEKSYVDSFLRKNPVMLNAWLKTGYQLD